MSYCPTHGSFDDYFNHGCPTCRAAEERAEVDREEIRNALSEIAHTTANLGDYVCPHCMQTSLREGASRCPLCQGEIVGNYWNAVWARKKAAAERNAAALKAAAERKRAMDEEAAAELIRTAPEREAAARAAALAAASAAAIQRQTAILKSIASLVAGAIGGFIAGFIAGLIIGIPVMIVGGIWMNDSNKGAALANTVAKVVVVLGVISGAVIGWSVFEEERKAAK